MSKRKTILAVSSGGGHWVQLLRIAPAFEGHRTVYASVNPHYSAQVGGSAFYCVPDVTGWNKSGCFILGMKLLRIILLERPDVVLTTGALPGLVAIYLAKSLRKKTVWIDSIANVDQLSTSGLKAGRCADLWLTQWAHLSREDGPWYRGQVL